VLQHVVGGRSKLGHLLQHLLHEVHRLFGHCIFEFDVLVQLLHRAEISNLVGFERHVSVKHSIQADSCAPDVYREALVPHVLHDLWCDVGRGAALFEEQFVLFDLPTNSEVTDLDVAMAVQQDVVQLDVTMGDLLVVQVGDTFHDLAEHELSIFLSQLPALADVVEEVTSWAELHNDHVMALGLESLEDFDVVGVAQPLQDIDLVHNLLLLALFLHEVHVDALDGDQLTRQAMQPQVDLSEGSLAQHLADLIELQLSLGWFVVLMEAVYDQLLNQEHLL